MSGPTQRMTSRELIESYIELELEKEYLELDSTIPDEDKVDTMTALTTEIDSTRDIIKRKTDAVDSFSLELSRQEGVIEGEIQDIRTELTRLLNRKKAVERSKEYFKSVILPMIIETCGNDGVFKTDAARYKLYEAWGPLEVVDEDRVPDDYKRYKVEIDKKKARKPVIAATESGLGISGFAITKKKRVRKT